MIQSNMVTWQRYLQCAVYAVLLFLLLLVYKNEHPQAQGSQTDTVQVKLLGNFVCQETKACYAKY